MAVVTIGERRAIAIERLRRAGAEVSAELRAYALAHEVEFSVFGSFARGDLVETSDFDVMIEGAADRLVAARTVAEAACERHGLRPDVFLAPEVSERLMTRVRRDGIVLA